MLGRTARQDGLGLGLQTLFDLRVLRKQTERPRQGFRGGLRPREEECPDQIDDLGVGQATVTVVGVVCAQQCRQQIPMVDGTATSIRNEVRHGLMQASVGAVVAAISGNWQPVQRRRRQHTPIESCYNGGNIINCLTPHGRSQGVGKHRVGQNAR
ncbi:hypothetical protein GCM10027089_41380 [Nocardia thraciensis]